jgi:hypothetical protein
MKKATKRPEGHFPGLQEFMDRLPEIVALMKPEPPPQIPYTPYKPPPDRWVFGKRMALNLTQLLEGASLVWLSWERIQVGHPEDPAPILAVHHGKAFKSLALEANMIDSVVAALQERFPDWSVFWPEMPPKRKLPRLPKR